MPQIKVRDIAYGRLRAPNLDAMEEFLTDFGMRRAARTPDALYMRGTDGDHHIHVTEKGDPGFIGLAYHATSEEDLKQLAKAPGASAVETLDEPGGGQRVRLREPNGYQIEVIFAQETLEPIPVSFQKLNNGADGLNRVNEPMRIHTGASRVKRIGHGVLASPRVMETVTWFRETLGFVRSDDVYAGKKDNIIGSFNRCDQGDDYVDHHVFFCINNEKAGLNHLSFEVQNLDDVFTGHEHLKKNGSYEHFWGLGRHNLGSQVFDYWSDPWGHVHEHWSDSDRMNLGDGGNLVSAEEGLGSQWGEGAPDKFKGHASP
jgi:catechol 2,3-dioxygenase-like lactoylglutathione lyase family enzyme